LLSGVKEMDNLIVNKMKKATEDAKARGFEVSTNDAKLLIQDAIENGDVAKASGERMLKQLDNIGNDPVKAHDWVQDVNMKYKKKYERGVKSRLVVVDMAGREDPMDILNDYVDISKTYANVYPEREGIDKKKKLSGLVGYLVGDNKMDVGKIVLKDKSGDVEGVIKLFFEGLYINETINKLRYYLSGRSGKKITLQTFNGYTDAKDGYNVNGVHVNNKPGKKPKEWDGTIDQLKKYESRDSSKPTKYVMFCAVRQEIGYMSDILKTLEFANSVSSI
jgi:hypothetical protein